MWLYTCFFSCCTLRNNLKVFQLTNCGGTVYEEISGQILVDLCCFRSGNEAFKHCACIDKVTSCLEDVKLGHLLPSDTSKVFLYERRIGRFCSPLQYACTNIVSTKNVLIVDHFSCCPGRLVPDSRFVCQTTPYRAWHAVQLPLEVDESHGYIRLQWPVSLVMTFLPYVRELWQLTMPNSVEKVRYCPGVELKKATKIAMKHTYSLESKNRSSVQHEYILNFCVFLDTAKVSGLIASSKWSSLCVHHVSGRVCTRQIRHLCELNSVCLFVGNRAMEMHVFFCYCWRICARRNVADSSAELRTAVFSLAAVVLSAMW